MEHFVISSETIGARIRAHRLRVGLTCRAAADLLGISLSEYEDYETGRSEPAPAIRASLTCLFEAEGSELESEFETEDTAPLQGERVRQGLRGVAAGHRLHGKGRERYLQDLRDHAEENWAQVEARLEREANSEMFSSGELL